MSGARFYTLRLYFTQAASRRRLVYKRAAVKVFNTIVVLSMMMPNAAAFAAPVTITEQPSAAREGDSYEPARNPSIIDESEALAEDSVQTIEIEDESDHPFGIPIEVESQTGSDMDTLIYGNTDGTYYYPVAAYLLPGDDCALAGVGFKWDDPENVLDHGDDTLFRGHYPAPCSTIYYLTLDFGGVITVPEGNWMYSKTGSIDDPDTGHDPTWNDRQVFYSLYGIKWPHEEWPEEGLPDFSHDDFGPWPANKTGDGTTTWTTVDNNTIPTGEQFRFLRIKLEERRGIAPVEGWEHYNDIELLMDSFRVRSDGFFTIPEWLMMLGCYNEDVCDVVNPSATVANPINTLTGGYDFNVTDLSLTTLAGSLTFNRTYASLTTDMYNTLLGYGWTHNHDVQLIFADTVSDRPGTVHFKAHSASQYGFAQQKDGTFLPFPGVLAELAFDEGPPVTYTVTDPGQNRYVFDEAGKLLTKEDAQGRALSYSYDADDRLEQISDGSGRYLTLSYDAEDRIDSVADHSGRSVTFAYDATSGDLTSVTDVLGGVWTYAYDSEHRMTEVIDPRGVTVERTEYGFGIPEALDFNDYTVSSYDDDNGSYSIQDNGTTLYIQGNAWKKIVFPYEVTTKTMIEFDYRSEAQAEVQGIAFDNDNGMSAGYSFRVYGTQNWGIGNYDNYEQDAPQWKHYTIPVGQYYQGSMQYLGFINDHDVSNPTGESYFSNIQVYEAEIHAVRQYNGEGELVVELSYNPDGTTTIVDGLGNSHTHTYDVRNTNTGQTDALGGTQEKTYDPNFRPATITDEDGDTTQLAWSEDGANLTQVIDAEGNPVDLDYDENNNLTSVVDPLGAETTYTYDGSLLTSSTDDAGNTTSYTYTPEGYLESASDAQGNTTFYTYDEYGQRTSMTDALGNTWLYRYDDMGRLVESEDPDGVITRNEYDAAGRLIRSTRNYDPTRPQNDENLCNIITEYFYDAVGNQIEVIDTYGRVTQYEYDDANRLIRTIDPDGNETTNTYNEAGQLIANTDALGHTTTYVYDELGRLVETHDALGNVTTTVYNPDGTVASTSDALGNSTTYTYDDLKRVVATTDAVNGTTTTTYDEASNVVATTDALGNTTTYVYNSLGQLTHQTDPEGGITQYVYDELGNRVQTIDPRGNSTYYAYDELGRLETVTDELGDTTTYTYDALGNRLTVTDAEGNTTSYSYDDLGRQVSVTDPLGNTTTTTYDALGNAISRTDANGETTSYVYDILGRLESQTDPRGGTTSYTYDDAGNQLSVTDAGGHTSTTVYDELNRPVSVSDPSGSTTTTTYDAAGNVIATTDGSGQTTTFTYDELGRQGTISDPLGNTTTYAYDAAGNRVSMTDAEGVVTRYGYDGLNRLSAVIENSVAGAPADHETNVRTEYSYDANGNRLTILDGRGHTTNFSYDALNRLQSEADPLGNTTGYTYNAVGNRVSMTDAEGFITSYVYDGAGRLTTIDYPDPDTDVSFTYDANGNRLSMSDGAGTTNWVYDELGRVTSVTDPFGDTVSYAYDAVGNRVTLTYPDGKTVSYVYDSADRLTQVSDWDNGVTDYTYDAASRLATVTLPKGVVTTYNYDEAGQLLTLTHEADGTLLSSFSYNYDSVGNRTQAVEYYLEPGGGGGPTVNVQVVDERGDPLPGLPVYAFDGTTYTGYHETTDENGEAAITLPEGDYRFRVDVDGTQFWSGEANHCAIAGCTDVLFTIPDAVLVSVHDTSGTPMDGLPVYVFDGTTYTGKHATMDANGEAVLRLVEGSYRFRADLNGTQFWSGESNHCDVPGCTLADVSVTIPVTVTVMDSLGMPVEGIPVYAFSGGSYSGYHGTSDANGEVILTLPQGDYRFRADSNGTQFWSGETDHCSVPGCLDAAVEITLPVTVTVEDTDGTPLPDLLVYAFDETTYTGYHATTDASGEVSLTLPQGEYRFRADFNGTQFWSGASNHCTIPGCTVASITVTLPVTVTVLDTDGSPVEGLPVYAFDETTYTGYHATTDASGEVSLTLPQGDYRFRADKNGTQFWSSESNHCTVPGCDSAAITVTLPVVVLVKDVDEQPLEGIPVYAFDGTSYTGYHATTDGVGRVELTLPHGEYRFRADHDGEQYWSGDTNHCTVPGCTEVTVVAGEASQGTFVPGAKRSLSLLMPSRLAQESTVLVTVLDTDGQPAEGLPVYAFNESAYTGVSATTDVSGWATLDLPDGSYRFRADKDGTQFWSAESNHCTVPGCTEATVTVTIPVTVTVFDTDGIPVEGLPVYAFDDSTYTGFNATTDASGQVSLTLPQGDYRFRSDKNGTQFWSEASNHCAVPGCTAATITVTIPIVVTVLDTDGQPAEGLPVYAFNESAYTGYHGTTDSVGQVSLTLPQGEYRFRADKNGTQFWSGESNHCTLPGCTEASITVTLPVTITVLDTDGQPAEGLPVYAFDEFAYTGYHATTDDSGEVSLTLPQGSYRFRADKNGTQFWSGASNHCALPGCTETSITVTIPVTVTVQSQTGDPYPDLPLYAFSADGYTGFHGTTDENGQIVLTLPQGDYRFRADYDGVHFWSGETDHCSVPGCLAATVELPGGGETAPQSVVIDYTYDPLYRLTAADYDSGEYFHYTYDAVGNRLTQETHAGTNAYTYDIANRLTSVDGVSYTWSANGNLLSDGASTYTYNHANRLTGVTQGDDSFSYAYNGLGDRLGQTINGEATNYTLDLVAGLTQVLDDGTNVYLYGLDRVGEQQPAGWAYHLPDALGSVRQLTDEYPEVTLAQSYEPFGSVMTSSGLGETNYSFTGEWADGTGLVHLRARYYAPWQGRFLSRDAWSGDSNAPMSFNAWVYGYANPVNYADPTGYIPLPPSYLPCKYCYDIKDPAGRKLCIEVCQCGSEHKGCPTPSGVEYGYRNKAGGERFVELIQECPGWWHDTSSFNLYNENDMAKFALAFEVMWESNKRMAGNHYQAFIEAISHKYWQMRKDYPYGLDGLYWTLVGSESVIKRVNNHHLGVQPFDKDPDTIMGTYIHLALQDVNLYIYGKYYGENGGNYQFQTRPYEWGNPPGVHPELLGRKKGVCPGQVYSISDGHTKVNNNDQCVLSFHQERCLTEPEKYEDVCSLSCDRYKEIWLHEAP